MEEVIQVTFTAPSAETAERIGRRLVERRLAACAQVSGPVTSLYWWKGVLEEAKEYRCVLKARRALYPAIEREIKALHPYEVPEIVATLIDEALPGYAAWIVEETAVGPSLPHEE